MNTSIILILKILNVLLACCWAGFVGYSLMASSNHTGIKTLPLVYCLLAMGILLYALLLFKKMDPVQIVVMVFLCIGFGATLFLFHHLHLMMNYEDWLKAGMPEKPLKLNVF